MVVAAGPCGGVGVKPNPAYRYLPVAISPWSRARSLTSTTKGKGLTLAGKARLQGWTRQAGIDQRGRGSFIVPIAHSPQFEAASRQGLTWLPFRDPRGLCQIGISNPLVPRSDTPRCAGRQRQRQGNNHRSRGYRCSLRCVVCDGGLRHVDGVDVGCVLRCGGVARLRGFPEGGHPVERQGDSPPLRRFPPSRLLDVCSVGIIT
jgi:hypothetical protein